MSTRAKVASVVASTGVLLVGLYAGVSSKDGSAASVAAGSPAAQVSTDSGQSGSGSGAGAGSTSGESGVLGGQSDSQSGAVVGSGSSSGSTGANGTFTGQAVQFQYGTMSVSVTYSNGTITDVNADVTTDGDRKSEMISSRAISVLRSEVLSANSAEIASVSGATYTSEAYKSSLQSAIDQAGV